MKYRLPLLLACLSFPPVAAAEPEPPPAAFAPKARILFQGDSITDMARGRGTDPNHILGHSYVFLIAAKYGAAFPELEIDFVNRGVGGSTVLDLEKRWQKDTLDLKPDLLSIPFTQRMRLRVHRSLRTLRHLTARETPARC